jgi:hypothetical protein
MNDFASWPGFAPAIHVLSAAKPDARHKAGHDELLFFE